MVTQHAPILRQIDAAIGRGDIGAASALAERALANGAEHPGLLNLAGHAAIRRGDFERALELLARARTRAPADVHVLNTLGIVYKKIGRLADAEEAFDAAVAVDPSYANAFFNKGTVLEAQNRRDEAEAAYESAAALSPDFADALGRLSFLAAMRGAYERACDYALRAARHSPGESLAPLRVADFAIRRGDHQAVVAICERVAEQMPDAPAAILIMTKAEVAMGDWERAKARLQPLLQGEKGPGDSRAVALSLLGQIREQTGEFAAAFDAYAASKAEIRANYASTYGTEDGGTVQAMRVARAIEYFSSAPASLWRDAEPAASSPVREHIFLVGFPRSGTTFLEMTLAGHPELATMQEEEGFAEMRELFDRPGGWQRVATLDGAGLERYRAAYWRVARAAVPTLDGTIFVDKQPLNSLLLPFVAKLFPAARILFALRDPRDVVLSCFKHQFTPTPPMYEFSALGSAAGFYDSAMGLAEIYRAKFGLTIMNTRYEDLVTDFDGTTRAICDFLGVDWTPALRDVAATSRRTAIATPSGPQLARGLYDGSGQWRRYRDQMAPVLPVLAPWVEKFGYKRD